MDSREYSEALKKVDSFLKEEMAELYRNRPFLEHAVAEYEQFLKDVKEDQGSAVFISAPTGYGKTALSMAISYVNSSSKYKAIISYPLRSLIEDQKEKFARFYKWVGKEDHVGIRMMSVKESSYFVHPVVLTTIDTLSLIAIGLEPQEVEKVYKDKSAGHFLFSWASVWLSALVFDEVHLLFDSTKSMSLLIALLKLGLNVFSSKMFFLSATMPRIYYEKIKSYLGKSRDKSIFIDFKPELDEKFVSNRKNKKYRINLLSLPSENKFDILTQLLHNVDFTKALVIFNTVEDAVEFYRKVDKNNKILLHSRFTIEDKKKKLDRIHELSKGNSEKFVLVSTQSIEAGVDISSDLIITELAPASSLVQRFGRFLRRESEECKNPERCAFVWYEDGYINNSSSKYKVYKVYDVELTRRTKEYLEKHSDINLHDFEDYEKMLAQVYLEDDIKIDRCYIDNIINIFTGLLYSTKSALDILIQKEGSLIREGSLFMAESIDGNIVPVEFKIIEKYCVEADRRRCPTDKRKALISALSRMGEKGPPIFKVNCSYNSETGLECRG
ncbi:MAG: CRISPR-associated helicase Cas3' [Fervidicoccaceae archaeon]